MSIRAMRHLMWKDLRLASSLLMAGIAGVLLLFPIGSIVSGFGGGDSEPVAFALWSFLPFLVAIGAPPTLVGHENERGTLDWLRTLPVTWQSHLVSKLIIAISAWFIVYSIACVALYLSLGDASRNNVANMAGFFLPVMIYVPIILLGFLSSFLIRNGLVSAIASIFGALFAWPLLAFMSFQFHRSFEFLFGWHPSSDLSAILTGVGFVLFLFVAMCWLARRRFAGTSDEILGVRPVRRDYRVKRPLAFKPNAAVHLRHSFRPRPAFALLWQQFRQTRWLLIGCLTAGTFFSLTGFSLLFGGPAFNFTPLRMSLVNLVCCTLGVSCFHSERLFNRAGFFSDRGVPAFSVWWTRLIAAGVATALLSLISALSQEFSNAALSVTTQERSLEAQVSVFLNAGPVICFLIGVIVGQCGTRAMVVYCSAPILAIFWTMPVQGVFNLYPQFFWMLWPSLLVLLFATYRLTRFVMENQTGSPVILRGLAYGALAWLVITVLVGNQVYQTTPAARPEVAENLRLAYKKAETQKIGNVLQQGYKGEASIRYAMDSSGPIQFYDYQVDTAEWTDDDFANATSDKLRRMPKDLYILAVPDPDVSPNILRGDAFNQQLMMEEHLSKLQDDQDVSIGLGSRNRWLTKFVRSPATDQRDVAIEIALREATLARQSVFRGGDQLDRLLRIAEVNERIGVFGLQQWMKDLNPSDAHSFQRLVELIPSEKLRKESRRRALLHDWHRFDSGYWKNESHKSGIQTPKIFAGVYFLAPRYDLSIERIRARRNIEQGTWLALRQLETGLPSSWDAELAELKGYWHEAFLPWYSYHPNTMKEAEHMIPSDFPIFLREHELLIERIQEFGQTLSDKPAS